MPKLCEEPGCKNRARYGVEDDWKYKFCKDHKKDGMKSLGIRCKYIDENGNQCKERAFYCENGSTSAKLCSKHKLDDMNYDKNRYLCIYTDQNGIRCDKQASFSKEKGKKAKYCGEHSKLFGYEINVRYRECEVENCSNVARYGFWDEYKRRRCDQHQEKGMRNLYHKQCEYIYDNGIKCEEYARWGYKNAKKVIFCSYHKKDDMIDIAMYNYQMCVECNNIRGEKREQDPDNRYCINCYLFKFPDASDAVKPPSKQKKIIEEIEKYYSQYDITFDKIIPNKSGNRYRPDVLIRLINLNIIIEIDEHQHTKSKRTQYDCDCEFKRIFDIHTIIGYDKCLLIIRFNPDAYTNNANKKIPSIFHQNLKINKAQFRNRVNTTLFNTLDHYIKNNGIINDNNPLLPKVIYLYYDFDKNFDIEEYYHYLTNYKLKNDNNIIYDNNLTSSDDE